MLLLINKIHLKHFLVVFLICLLHGIIYSKNISQVDSLLNVLGNTKEDTVILRTYRYLCDVCETKDNLKYAGTAIKLADKLLAETTDIRVKKNIVKQKAAFYIYLRVYFSEFDHNSKPLLNYSQSLLLNYQNLHDSIGIVDTKIQISNYYLRLYDAHRAMDYCQQALTIAQEINYKHGIAKSLTMKARLYKDYGNITQALVNIEQALLIYEAVKDTEKVSDLLKQKGDFNNQLKNVDEAVACYQKAITLNKEMNSIEGLRDAYNQLGLIYSDNGDLDNAMKNYRIALIYAEKLPDKTWMRGILGNIGDILREQGNISAAINFHTRAFNEIKGLKMERQEAWVNWQFAQDYLHLRNYPKAKAYNDSYLKIMKKFSLKDGICNGEKLGAEIDSALGNFKGAYLHHQQYMYCRDQLNSEEIKKQAIKEKFQTEFDEQKKRDVLMQNQKEAIAEQQLQKQKVIRNSFIAGSILLMLLIVVLINRNKLKRTIEMEKMRSRLSRDLHDDIGSTLSSINILSRTAQSNLTHSQDEKTRESLEKINERSQRLLDNMSDIIWNINPGNDTIEEVMSRMREYATTILEAKNIDYTFNFPKEKLDCTLTMEVKNNMYLIFKEAVNNLSKYSGATHATLSLTFDEKNIHLIVEDNGKGFNDSEIKHRGGLSNMQHRAEEIRGTMNIKTVAKEGTIIKLTMPRYC